MGFYTRTSLRAGPFRFTMSPSGMGVSVGVPGFRVGTGPRGNYVHMGRGGIYYQSTIGKPAPHSPPRPRPYIPPSSSVVMEDVTGASVQELVAGNRSDLVNQIQVAARRRPLWPFALGALLVLGLILGRWGLLLILVGVPAIVWLAMRDRARRSVVVMYDVNDDMARRFDDLVQAVGALQQVGGFWLITASGAVQTPYQYKVNAGASTLHRRRAAAASMNGPRILVTNVAIPTLTSGERSVHFLPDRVLLREGKHYADIPYQQLELSAEAVRVIEEGALPRDGEIVDRTWQYVNVKGGPDRRFKDNRQLPVMRYGRLTLYNHHGLHMIWDASQFRAVHATARALTNAASAQPPIIPS
ncbi:DUF4236 domain-containing protein [Nonomuraea harbinensis]|uniref:DUF4236 domain-containing protein n=1 Tax=Nonomuraea harbinensis TaxID=1286938 RepID=A0ABW1C2B9_9ACTN|nr:DUF4236 domain-containing protein [Nonomuraea harbinensis]